MMNFRIVSDCSKWLGLFHYHVQYSILYHVYCFLYIYIQKLSVEIKAQLSHVTDLNLLLKAQTSNHVLFILQQ